MLLEYARATPPARARRSARRPRSRRRMSVDDTGAVGASTSTMRGSGRATPPDGSTMRAASVGQSVAAAPTPASRPRDDHEVAAVEQTRVVLPGGDLPKRVGARDEEQRGASPRRGASRSSVVDVYDGSSRSSRGRTTPEPVLARDGQRDHREPVRRRARAAARDAAARRPARATTRSRSSARARPRADVEVAAVDRVERAAETGRVSSRRPRASARCARPRATSLRAARAALAGDRRDRVERRRRARLRCCASRVSRPGRRARRSCWPRRSRLVGQPTAASSPAPANARARAR